MECWSTGLSDPSLDHSNTPFLQSSSSFFKIQPKLFQRRAIAHGEKNRAFAGRAVPMRMPLIWRQPQAVTLAPFDRIAVERRCTLAADDEIHRHAGVPVLHGFCRRRVNVEVWAPGGAAVGPGEWVRGFWRAALV